VVDAVHDFCVDLFRDAHHRKSATPPLREDHDAAPISARPTSFMEVTGYAIDLGRERVSAHLPPAIPIPTEISDCLRARKPT
jgi:hypothetical protein